MILDTPNTENKLLQIGYIYTGVPSWEGAEYVFIQEYMNYHDNIYTFVFWDLVKGKEVYVTCRELDIVSTLQLCKEIRAEMPYIHAVNSVAIDHVFPSKNSLEFVTKNALYFIELIEGKSNIDNWFQWRIQNEQELANALKRVDFMRLKVYPLTTIARLLDLIQATYTVSPRYAWLDQSIL